MTKRLWIQMTLALLSCSTFFLPMASAEPPNFPDYQSFTRVQGISTEILSYDNMSEVALTPLEIKTHIIKKVGEAGVQVISGNGATTAKKPLEKMKNVRPQSEAILGIRLRRTEDSALFGATKIGNVSVTLQLFQRVTLKHNHHSTQAITWSESHNISGGSKRPKKILEALDKLIEMFVSDFLKGQPVVQ